MISPPRRRALEPRQPARRRHRGLRAHARAGADRLLRAPRLLLGRDAARPNPGGPSPTRRRCRWRSPTTGRLKGRARSSTAPPRTPVRAIRSRSASTGASTTTRSPTTRPGPADDDLPAARRALRELSGISAGVLYGDILMDMSTCTDTDRVHLARAIELARKGLGAVKPNPVVGAVDRARRRDARRGLARGVRRAPRRGQRDRGVRPGRSERSDAVRVARAVLPRGQDAAVHRGDPAGRHRAAWSSPPTTRPRRPRAAGSGILRDEGVEVVIADGELAATRAAAQPGLPQARPRRAPVGAVQVGDDARRQGRDPRRATPSGSPARTAASSPTAGAPRSTRSSSASARRSPTTRS